MAKTLGEYRDFCVTISGEDSPATKFFDNKIKLQGRDELVVADESQMLLLINSDQLTVETEGGLMGRPGRPKATHCKRGHEFTAESTVWNKKGRACRICKNASAKIRYNANEELRRKLNDSAADYRARLKQLQELK